MTVDIRALASSSNLSPAILRYWSTSVATGKGYERTSIPQKRRRPREVLMPSRSLDRVLKQLRLGLERTSGYVAPPEVHGFLKGRDIASNARQHLDQDVVLRIDLKDFFGAVDEARLRSALESCGFDAEATRAVCDVALVDGGLAQGFSTSPFLSNLVFVETDHALAACAEDVGVTYSRYVDDLTFSGPKEVVDDALLRHLQGLLGDLGWQVNPSKTRFMRRGKAQYVTGLYVGDAAGPHIPRPMKRLLRREVYFAVKYGVADARRRSPTPMESGRLSGWVHYAAHADAVFGESLRRRWAGVDLGRIAFDRGEGWDELFDEVGLPEYW